jgi:hypothetical protein
LPDGSAGELRSKLKVGRVEPKLTHVGVSSGWQAAPSAPSADLKRVSSALLKSTSPCFGLPGA